MRGMFSFWLTADVGPVQPHPVDQKLMLMPLRVRVHGYAWGSFILASVSGLPYIVWRSERVSVWRTSARPDRWRDHSQSVRFLTPDGGTAL
jgi:hypothetical protein